MDQIERDQLREKAISIIEHAKELRKLSLAKQKKQNKEFAETYIRNKFFDDLAGFFGTPKLNMIIFMEKSSYDLEPILEEIQKLHIPHISVTLGQETCNGDGDRLMLGLTIKKILPS